MRYASPSPAPPPWCASGKTAEGIQELEKALSCKYVLRDATKALNKIFQVRTVCEQLDCGDTSSGMGCP